MQNRPVWGVGAPEVVHQILRVVAAFGGVIGAIGIGLAWYVFSGDPAPAPAAPPPAAAVPVQQPAEAVPQVIDDTVGESLIVADLAPESDAPAPDSGSDVPLPEPDAAARAAA